MVLGGDHLGPNPWRHLPAEAALAEAEAMVAAYVAAGYEKIHLDTSMGCQGEPEHLADAATAARAARLAPWPLKPRPPSAGTAPRYVIGTEVPVPGGVRDRDRAPRGDPPGRRRRHPRSAPAGLCRGRRRRPPSRP